MEIKSHNRSVLIALLLSLIIHFAILLLISLERSGIINLNPTPPDIEYAKKTPDTEWAETKARSSQFSAPVVFEDADDNDTYDTSKTRTDIDNNNATDSTTDTNDTIPSSLPTAPSALTQTPEQIPSPIPPSTPEAIVAPLQPEPVKEKTELAPIPQQTPQIPPKEMAKRLTDTKPANAQQHTKAPTQQVSLAKPSTPQPTQQASVVKPAQSKKNTPTLAQLTQGFLNQPKDEGKYMVNMLGKKEGRPTDEQLKYEAYLQKLGNCLQSSFNINSNRLPSHEPTDVVVEVFFALNKDGTMRQLQIAKSSGDLRLDQFTLFVIRDASSSFPPVPQYLPHDPFSIMYRIAINTTYTNRIGVYRY